ncbi:hypothetical protein K474DRAFT_1713375 [Panus rudis PR-1116 ss-1]|nr:hypothetical protein K474DRAFT_1713375 [Panus rudis PR-1116 ss-1]
MSADVPYSVSNSRSHHIEHAHPLTSDYTTSYGHDHHHDPVMYRAEGAADKSPGYRQFTVPSRSDGLLQAQHLPTIVSDSSASYAASLASSSHHGGSVGHDMHYSPLESSYPQSSPDALSYEFVGSRGRPTSEYGSNSPPLTSPQSASANPSASRQALESRPGPSRQTSKRKEKPRIELAPDQPLTTQGKPRARVYVACAQW